MNSLLPLVDHGLLQFGIYRRLSQNIPIDWGNLRYMASYPAVLRALVADAAPSMHNLGVDFLLALPDAVPLGVALSQAYDVPLVYSQGCGENAVQDFIGAYDIGHPTCLIAGALDGFDFVDLRQRASRVGLEIERVLGVIDPETITWGETTQVDALIDLPEALQHLVELKRLPPGQAQAVRDWLNRRRPG